MDARGNFLHACRRENPEWVPYDFALSPALAEEFALRTGRTDYRAYFALPYQQLHKAPTRLATDYTRFFGQSLLATDQIDQWGVGHAGDRSHTSPRCCTRCRRSPALRRWMSTPSPMNWRTTVGKVLPPK